MSDALKRIVEARQKKRSSVGDFARCSFANDYPLLFALLHDTPLGGSERQRGSLSIFIEEGAYKACVSDRSDGVAAFVTGATFNEILERCERGLEDGSLEWRGNRKSQYVPGKTR